MLRDIPDQEWNEYVKKCTTGEWPVPAGFVSDKNIYENYCMDTYRAYPG